MASQPLIKIILSSMAGLLIIMLLVSGLDIVNTDKIEQWLYAAQGISRVWLVSVIIALLFVDLLLSIPTLLIAVLSGFFLGTTLGAITVFCGLFGTVTLGYGLGRQFGHHLLPRLCGSEQQQALLAEQYQHHAPLLIVFARAVPMMPEITAVLSGSHAMPYWQFIGLWALGTAPYCVIASYSGSLSSTSDPKPALIGMLALMAGLWLIAGGLKWFLQKQKPSSK